MIRKNRPHRFPAMRRAASVLLSSALLLAAATGCAARAPAAPAQEAQVPAAENTSAQNGTELPAPAAPEGQPAATEGQPVPVVVPAPTAEPQSAPVVIVTTGTEPQPASPDTPALSVDQKLIAAATLLCTGSPASVTAPSSWDSAGSQIMLNLAARNGYNLSVREGCPYLIAVNRAANTVTVYTPDGNGTYTVPYMAMVCSTGKKTPLGSFNIPEKSGWQLLYGPCYGQYATRIDGPYLFHSIPYYTENKDNLETEEFTKLGTPASLGCIRLQVADAKWIYDHCPVGTPVVIYDDAAIPGPMGKPGTIAVRTEPQYAGWDPTDPDPVNPYDDSLLPGTAIRSEKAWQEFSLTQYSGTVTPTVLSR